jgi:hypothetical protein
LNAPEPLVTEKGAERVPTFPVSAEVESTWLAMVRVWVADCPVLTFPKFTNGGATDMAMTVQGPCWRIETPFRLALHELG